MVKPSTHPDETSADPLSDSSDSREVHAGSLASHGGLDSGASAVSLYNNMERYRFMNRLGTGGMGVVYEVYDEVRKRTVALKVLRGVDPEAILRFKREFRALADINHPNLVSLYELSKADDRWYFTMELVRGATFLEYVQHREQVAAPRPSLMSPNLAGARPSIVDWEGQAHDADVESAKSRRLTETISSPPLSPPVPQDPADVPSALNGGVLSAKTEQQLTSRPSMPPVSDTLPPSPPSVRVGAVQVDYERLRDAVCQLTEGILFLHHSGRLHRDVKPGNVLVSGATGRVVLCDFGLVADLEAERYVANQDDVLGTLGYMSPEQLANRTLTGASDLYSVGAMMYEALTGRLPLERELQRDPSSKLHIDPEDVQSLTPDTPDDLAEVCMGLLSRDPVSRPSGEEILTRLGRGRGPRLSARLDRERFFGRRRELAELRRVYDRSAHDGRAVFISGPPGLGKTALARHFTANLQETTPHAVVLSTRCYSREALPFNALDGIIDALSAVLADYSRDDLRDVIPRDVEALARVFPVLNRIEPRGLSSLPPERIGGNPQELRRRALAALRELLARIAHVRPVVLVVDDLHWGDLDSAEMLLELFRTPAPPSLLLIGTFSAGQEKTAPILRRIFAEDSQFRENVEHIRLQPLEQDEVEEQIEELLGAATNSATVMRIAKQAQGNPLLVNELVHFAAHNVEDSRTGSFESITVDEIVQLRIVRLAPQTRMVVQTLAVAGRPTSIDELEHAVDIGEELRPAIATLLSENLVRASIGLGSEHIECAHDRVRVVAKSMMSESGQMACHRRLAEALEEQVNVQADALVEHWLGAGMRDQAATAALLAADEAIAALEFERAAVLLELALETPRTDADVAVIRRRRAEILVNAGRSADAAEAFLVAADVGPSSGRTDLLRRAALEFLRSGYVDRGLVVLRRVTEPLGIKFPSSQWAGIAQILFTGLVAGLLLRRFREKRTAIDESTKTRIDIYWTAVEGLGWADTFKATAVQALHLRAALRSGDPLRAARALTFEAGIHATRGPRGRARANRYVDRARELARGAQENVPILRAVTALIAYQSGRYRKAIEWAKKTVDFVRESGAADPWTVAIAHLQHVWSLYYLGDVREYRARVQEFRAAAAKRGDQFAVNTLSTGLAAMEALYADEPDRLAHQVEAAMATWSNDGFHLEHFWEGVALAHRDLYRGDAQAAFDRMTVLHSASRRALLHQVVLLRFESRHLRARAALAVLANDPKNRKAMRIAKRDARAIARFPEPSLRPFGRLLKAQILTIEERFAQATDLFAIAAEELDSASYGLFSTVARLRHAQLGGANGPTVQAVSGSLLQSGIVRPHRVARMLVPVCLPGRRGLH